MYLAIVSIAWIVSVINYLVSDEPEQEIGYESARPNEKDKI